MKSSVYGPWMYYIIWIQRLWRASIHSYESWRMKPQMADFLGLKIPGSDAALPLRTIEQAH